MGKLALLCVRVRLAAPGPEIVRALLMLILLARVMVAGKVRLKMMVSPELALATACLKLPGPVS
jgi:hypothetical protein